MWGTPLVVGPTSMTAHPQQTAAESEQIINDGDKLSPGKKSGLIIDDTQHNSKPVKPACHE
jgi:hypothetical protein